MTDFASWLSQQSDAVQQEHARQRSPRQGQWLTRLLMVPAVLFAAVFVSLPVGGLYVLVPSTFNPLSLGVIGSILAAAMLALDQWDHRQQRETRSLALQVSVLLALPLLGIAATGHFLVSVAVGLENAFTMELLGSILVVIGAISTVIVHQTLWRLIAALGIAVGLSLIALALFPLWVGLVMLVVLVVGMFAMERWPFGPLSSGAVSRLWAVRDTAAIGALIKAVPLVWFVDWPLALLLVPVAIYALARLWRGSMVQGAAILSFVVILIAGYYQTDVSFLIKAGAFAGLALLLGGAAAALQISTKQEMIQ